MTEIYLGWEYSAWYGRWMRPSAFGVVISVVDGACDSVQLAKHNVAVYSGSLDKLAVVKEGPESRLGWSGGRNMLHM